MKFARVMGLGVVLSSSLLLSACHFSNGDYGPANGGAAPVVGANGVPKTSAKLSGSNLAPKTASEYNGAGFPIPDYGPISYPGYNRQGDPTAPAQLSWRNSIYGPILTTASGYTLYVRLGDEFRKSECYKDCLYAFPPELTNGAPQASAGILAADLGVLTANNNWEQVSYGGHPLYRYRLDTKPGEIKAQGKGSIWYVISVDGLPIIKNPPASKS